jgi:hypothetical protein
VQLRNTTTGTTVIFTDNNVRYYRSDFSIPYATGAGLGSIFMDYSGVPFVVNSSGSVLTPQQIRDSMALPTTASPSAGSIDYT